MKKYIVISSVAATLLYLALSCAFDALQSASKQAAAQAEQEIAAVTAQ